VLIKGIGTKQYADISNFIADWQPVYKYSHPEYYINHIDKALYNQVSFNTLFLWKNGQKLSAKKQYSVDRYWEKRDDLIRLQLNFEWELFESNFEPEKNACVWKIFLMHILVPSYFPIYDQHVYRAFEFIHTGEIHEIPTKNKAKYDHFKNIYHPWFQQVRKNSGLEAKSVDEACFAFGKALQRVNMHPYKVYG